MSAAKTTWATEILGLYVGSTLCPLHRLFSLLKFVANIFFYLFVFYIKWYAQIALLKADHRHAIKIRLRQITCIVAFIYRIECSHSIQTAIMWSAKCCSLKWNTAIVSQNFSHFKLAFYWNSRYLLDAVVLHGTNDVQLHD